MIAPDHASFCEFAFISPDLHVDSALEVVGDHVVTGELFAPHLAGGVGAEITEAGDILTVGNGGKIVGDPLEHIGLKVVVIVDDADEVS